MRLLPLLCDAAVLVFFFHAGQLFMQLVLVQVVERPAARFCFTSCFALCLGLFYTALMNVAMAGGHLLQWQHWWFAADPTTSLLTVRREEQIRNNYHWQLFHFYLGVLLVLLCLVCPYMLLHFAAEGFFSRTRSQRYGSAGVSRQTRPVRRWYRRVVRRVVILCTLCAALMVILYTLYYGRWWHTNLAQLIAEPGPVPITSAGKQAPTNTYSVVGRVFHYVLHPFMSLLRRISRAVLQHSLPMPREVPHSMTNSPTRTADTLHTTGGSSGQRVVPTVIGMDSLATLSYCLSVVTAYVATVGVACIGFLAGYASFATPYSFITPRLYWSRRAEALQAALHALGKRQTHILAIYAEKQRRIAQENYYALRENTASRITATSGGEQTGRMRGVTQKWDSSDASSTSSLATRMLPRWSNSLLRRTLDIARGATSPQTRAQRLTQLAAEVDSTRYLSLAVFLQMSELDTLLTMALYGKTWVGLYYVLIGVLLAGYTLVKFIVTVVSLLAARRSAADPITTAMQLYDKLQHHNNNVDSSSPSMPSHEMHSGLIYTLGLLLNAQMVLSSIRGLLLMLFQLTVSFGAVVTANTTAVGLAMLMGCYFIGQLVLLRQSLPTPSSGDVLHTAFAPLPVYYYQRLCDGCFIAGCVLTVVVQRIVFGDPMTAVQSAVGD